MTKIPHNKSSDIFSVMLSASATLTGFGMAVTALMATFLIQKPLVTDTVGKFVANLMFQFSTFFTFALIFVCCVSLLCKAYGTKLAARDIQRLQDWVPLFFFVVIDGLAVAFALMVMVIYPYLVI